MFDEQFQEAIKAVERVEDKTDKDIGTNVIHILETLQAAEGLEVLGNLNFHRSGSLLETHYEWGKKIERVANLGLIFQGRWGGVDLYQLVLTTTMGFGEQRGEKSDYFFTLKNDLGGSKDRTNDRDEEYIDILLPRFSGRVTYKTLWELEGRICIPFSNEYDIGKFDSNHFASQVRIDDPLNADAGIVQMVAKASDLKRVLAAYSLYRAEGRENMDAMVGRHLEEVDAQHSLHPR